MFLLNLYSKTVDFPRGELASLPGIPKQLYFLLSAAMMLLLITAFGLHVGCQLLFATVGKFLHSFHFGMNSISTSLEHRECFHHLLKI